MATDIKQIIDDCREQPEKLRQLDPAVFEAVVAELLAGFGWEVSITPPSRDGGYDILGLTTDSSGLQTSWVVECKRYDDNHKVGIQVARQIVGVKTHIGVPNALLVTTSSFTADVQEFSAARRDLQLADLRSLSDWLQRYSPPVTLSHTARKKFLSCFLSHASKDEAFAQKLAARLKAEGIAVWYAPDDIRPGDKIYDQVKQAILSFDRLLVVLSNESMKSNWVRTELAKALERERRDNVKVLFPVSLVSIDAIRQWECVDPDSGIDFARELRSYHIPDFSKWSDPAEFEKQVTKVINALRASDTVSTEPKSDAGKPQPSDLMLRKRISAGDRLWSAVLKLKDELSMPVFFFTILVPSEYDSALDEDGNMHHVVSSITDGKLHAAIVRVNQVEDDRPYLGERLWSQFFVYRAFLGRLATLILMGKKNGHIENWRKDGAVLQILTSLFGQKDLESVLGRDNDPHSIARIIDRLESLMLNEIRGLST